MSNALQLIFVIIALLASLINLVRRQWLVNVIALAIQYLAVFLLLTTVRPLGFAVIKLLVGWMSTLTILVTLTSLGTMQSVEFDWHLTPGEVFRLLAGVFGIVLLFFFINTLQSILFPATGIYLLMAALGLMVIGVLQLGMKNEPLYIVIALLTFLSGFELLYASLELSTVLEALFAAVDLGLALIGAYFIVKEEERITG